MWVLLGGVALLRLMCLMMLIAGNAEAGGSSSFMRFMRVIGDEAVNSKLAIICSSVWASWVL